MIIRKSVLLITLISQAFFISAQQNSETKKFTLSGVIVGAHTHFLQLAYVNATGEYAKDTCIVRNGQFKFTGYINSPVAANLTGRTESSSSDDLNFVMFFLEPEDMKCSLIEDDFKHAQINGSITQHEFDLLQKEEEPNRRMEDIINTKLKLIDKERQTDTSLALKIERERLWDSYQGYRALDKEIEFNFIEAHPFSYLSPYLMNYYFDSRMLTLDSTQLIFNKFHKSVQNSLYGKLIKEGIKNRELSAIGSKAPQFTRNDIDHKKIGLSDFEGKSYVLLDFWASWCEPCREITPQVKEMYQKFHPKGLDIISISWDFDQQAWMDAIKEDETGSWHNIFADVLKPNDSGMRGKYAVASIPTLILINKEGYIIGRYLGDGETGTLHSLNDKLNEVFSSR